MTCNILIPGGAADTNLLPGNPGDEGRSGADGMLVSPEVMQTPIKWLASTQTQTAGTANGLSGACGTTTCRHETPRKAAPHLPG